MYALYVTAQRRDGRRGVLAVSWHSGQTQASHTCVGYVVQLVDQHPTIGHPAGREWTVVIDRPLSLIEVDADELDIVPGRTLELTVSGCSPVSFSGLSGGMTRCWKVDRQGTTSLVSVPAMNLSTDFARQLRLDTCRPMPTAGCQINSLTVALDDATSRQTAVVRWRCDPVTAAGMSSPDKYHVTIRNLSFEINECMYHQWIFELDRSVREYRLPLWLRPGNRYQVIVRGLRTTGSRATNGCSGATPGNDVFESSSMATDEFRAGEVLSKEDMELLLDTARHYTAPAQRNLRTVHAKCKWAFRNKPRSYFQRILAGDGMMRTYLKDPSGDARCPINGEIKGLFFLATPRNVQGHPRRKSPFGDAMLSLPIQTLLTCAPNIYFADFSCLHGNDQIHHVTLVLTANGSEADRLCSERLPRLKVNDPVGNPFLFRDTNGQMNVWRPAFVDLFFTEDISISGAKIKYDLPTLGRGMTTQGGLEKSPRCGQCNIFSSRQVAGRPSRTELY